MERWVIIDSFPDYEISNLGRIRTAVQRPNARWPKGFLLRLRERLIRGIWYKTARLTRDGKRKEIRVHRLVCIAFHGQPPTPKHGAAHENGNSLDNRETNLYWATQQQNIDDRERHGRTMRGESHYDAKISSAIAKEIKAKLVAGTGHKAVAKMLGVSIHIVNDISRGRTWREVC